MPSFSPDSTFSPCRMREGRRGSVTTACPSAASVGARITARIRISARLNEPNSPAPSAQPARIVSGRPIPSRRAGTAVFASKRRQVDPRGVREEDQRQGELGEDSNLLARRTDVDPAEPLAPDDQAGRRKKIGAETGVRSRARESPA